MKHLSKSITALILILSLFSYTSGAQSVAQGNSIISVGYGFPNLSKKIFQAFDVNQDFKITGIGPLHLKYEYMISDNIGLGVSLNYVTFTATYSEASDSNDANFNTIHYTSKYKLTARNYSALLRFNYHFYTEDNVDVYWGLGAGIRGGSYSASKTPYDPTYSYNQKVLFPVGFETTVGLRYLITDNLGVYTEIGIGQSLIQFGACLKL